MTIMERLIEVETMEDREVHSKYKAGKGNVKKVLKVLLYDELKAEMEVEEPKKDRKPREKKEEVITT